MSMFKRTSTLAAAGLAAGLVAAAPAHALQFASFAPAGGSAPNIQLVGLSLTASAPVQFEYSLPPNLLALGFLPATLSLSATETGAVAFGPLALGTFDGSFNISYSGATMTVGAITVTHGESLLSGTFLGSVFTGYGTAASIDDSNLGGGLVAFNNNSLVSFTPPGGDEGLAFGIVNLNNPVAVVGGQLTDFTGVTTGNFAADNVVGNNGGGTPEPATWALMLIGVGAIGFVARRRAKVSLA
ncbi:MAG TPA: PEPxxWA-CTERM sorting domain-containing protein [Caulobacteraceae bacterium]|nr:PEPxxWA-CTERM sorting domain-containing protein [Caulobacteraceae bacterium]